MRWPARILSALMLASSAVVVSSGPVAAAVINVTTPLDVVDALDGVTSLREAMTIADTNGTADTINLVAATDYELTDCVAGQLAYSEANDLTIEGNGSTIEQTCTDERILDKTGPNTTVLTLADVVLVGGPNSGVNIDGAAIQARSRLVLVDVTISGVDAGFGGSVVAFDFGPAMIDLELQTVTIDGNTGRAVDNLNPAGILVEDSTITDNTGSGVSLGDGTPLTITNSTITGNGGHGVSTSGQGNGIQPVVVIADSTIADNGQGGFLCLQSCRTVTVTDSQITGNGLASVAGNGGGLVIPLFTDNFPPLQSVTITGSTISGNEADHDGAGVFVASSGEIDGPDSPQTSIIDSTIDANITSCATCDGGGVAVHVGNLSIDNSVISNNEAGSDGGGVEQVRVASDEIDDPSTFTMTGSIVTGNTAGGDGGGLWVHTSSTVIDTSLIEANTAVGSGGGLRVGGNFTDLLFESGHIEIDRSTIAGNGASSGGGVAIGFPDGSRARLTNATVTANSATTAGGGFAVGPTELLDLDHATVTANTAPVGANVATSGPTTIRASILAEGLGGGTNCAELPGAPPLVVPHLTNLGFSWFDDATCAASSDDLVDPGGDPELGPLGDNGGPTPTRLPAATSPVGALVPIASCLLPIDQRDVARPVGTGCEPGAVEVDADGGAPPIMGTNGHDLLLGTNGDDVILGLAGSDVLAGLGGDDTLEGGPGNDLLLGGPGNDTLEGGSGNDILIGGPGVNVLKGGPGFDILISSSAADTLQGGAGPDLCFFAGQIFPQDC